MTEKYIVLWFSKIIFNIQSDENKKIFRNLEKCKKKYINNTEHLNYNRICKNENLLPIYTNFIL